MLEAYEAPPLDLTIDEVLLDFIARGKAELPDGVSGSSRYHGPLRAQAHTGSALPHLRLLNGSVERSAPRSFPA